MGFEMRVAADLTPKNAPLGTYEDHQKLGLERSAGFLQFKLIKSKVGKVTLASIGEAATKNM
jgi:hypothetical protein